MVYDLPLVKHVDEVCENHVFGKQYWDVFLKRKARRAIRLIELVHANVCEPIWTSSLNNNKYFLCFVDDFRKMTYVYFAKEKSKALPIFKRFKNDIEKYSGFFLKILRCGGE